MQCRASGYRCTLLYGGLPRLQSAHLRLSVSEWLQDRLVDEGYNPSYGARPLRRAITRLLEDSMAEQMLRGDIKVCA